MNKTELSLSEKYALSITEAAAYFNISERRFRTFISDYIYADFVERHTDLHRIGSKTTL